MNRKEKEAELNRKIGSQIKAWRQHVGMSQAALSEELDVSQQTVQQWETGNRRISAPTLYLVAEAMDVSVALLFTK